MGYVAARGGLDAIRAAEELTRRTRAEASSPWLELDQIVERLPLAVDRVMGEGGLWDEPTAARALRQADGDSIEAAHLVRAHRSTLPRLAYTVTVDVDDIEVLRRIVPAFREPPGPQLLGRTPDYSGRLLDRTPEDVARDEAAQAAAARMDLGASPSSVADSVAVTEAPTSPDDTPADDTRSCAGGDTTAAPSDSATGAERRIPGRLLDVLRAMDLVVERRRADDPDPVDITRVPARPGAGRSARLAAMTRAETGALVQLWYRNILGPDNHLHEVTLGEVRHGRLPVPVVHPHTGKPVTIGHVRVTEVEAIEDIDGADEDRGRFDVGYGLCFGHNERKAIAMANLDIAVQRAPAGNSLEQSVLMTTDGLDASGFLEHLKLPHYVTFRSMIERKQAVRAARPMRRRVGATATSDCEAADPLGEGAALVTASATAPTTTTTATTSTGAPS